MYSASSATNLWPLDTANRIFNAQKSNMDASDSEVIELTDMGYVITC